MIFFFLKLFKGVHSDINLMFISIIFCLFLAPISTLHPTEWTTFNKDNSILPSNNCLCVTIDARGTKWFGTDNGLVQFDGDNWKLYTSESENNLADNFINDVVFEEKDNQSLLWIATKNGISLMDITDPESPTFIAIYRSNNSPLVSNAVNVMALDPGNVKWFGTFSGLSSLFQNDWGTYTTLNYWIDNDSIVSLASGPDSMVYIGTELRK